MTPYTVGYLVGSLSQASINRKVALALVRLAPPGLRLLEIPWGDLPVFNRDLEANFPAPAMAFKKAIVDVDAVLFVTPEYNRSIPGGLKNAIDWASRPYGKNALTRKPSAVIGASPGRLGTAIAQAHLRSILLYCNSPQLPVEAYVQFTPGLIADDGAIENESTMKFLSSYLTELEAFLDRAYTVLPRGAPA
jgi:chromate reductase